MSYRCEICAAVSQPGQPLRRWTILRPNKSINQEVKVCGACLHELEGGVSLRELAARYRGQVSSATIRVRPPATRPVIHQHKERLHAEASDNTERIEEGEEGAGAAGG